MDSNATADDAPTQQNQKMSIEALSKDELLIKYKSLLGIAKKAKQAKDEFAEENRKLKEAASQSETQKEADKKALLTMKEMLEEFTDCKLEMATQLSEMQQKSKMDDEALSQLRIENESFRRQIDRLTEDNDSLLNDIDRMENQLNQVNLLGKEQKRHLDLLEHEVNKLKEAENQNVSLQTDLAMTLEENKLLKEQKNTTTKTLDELTEKYQSLKEINSDQRKKFNSLKDRFIEVHRKLKKLKECKRILLETQYEYSEAVSKWQNEIINASRLLCAQMNALIAHNDELKQKLLLKDQSTHDSKVDIENMLIKLNKIQSLSELLIQEQKIWNPQHCTNEEENKSHKENLNRECQVTDAGGSSHKSTVDCTEYVDLELKRLSQELMDLKVKLNDKEDYIRTLEATNSSLKAYHHQLVMEQDTSALKIQQAEEINKLQTEIEDKRRQIIQLREQMEVMESEKIILHHGITEAESIKAEKERLQAEVVELSLALRRHDEGKEEKLKNLQDRIKVLEEEKAKLTIQFQQQQAAVSNCNDNDKLKTEIESLQIKLDNGRQAYEELLARCEHKEREHTDLLDEMRELNEALKARGDVISRQQEKHHELVVELKRTNAKLLQIEERLNEKEQSIMEKENEVRTVSKEIDDARNKVCKLESDCLKNQEHVRSLTEEIQNLRSACDPSADSQSDALSTSTLSRAEEFNRLSEVEDSFEEKYQKLRGLAVKLKKKLQAQTLYTAELEKQQVDNSRVQKELDDCNKTVNNLQHEREQTKKLIDTLKAENQKLKSSRKQANVLNLEIESAEKSLRDATSKLIEKSNEVEELQEALQTKVNCIMQLRQEISILESAKQAECIHSKELKEQIDRLNVQLKDAVHFKQNTLIANKDLEQSRENLKFELEEVRLQLANITSQHEKVLIGIRTEKENLEQQLAVTQKSLEATNAKLRVTERSLEDLRIEYFDYKTKAQAVLRKNQNTNSSKECELEEEVVTLRTVEKQLQATVQMHIKKIEEGDQRIQLLQGDNENLQKRLKDAMAVLEELRQQNEIMAQENQLQIQKHQVSLKNHREQIEDLESCYKTQLQELENSLQQLRSEYDNAIRAPTAIGATKTTPISAPQYVQSDEQSKIDYLLMEREDAEGSEEAEALATIAANRKISNASRRRSQQQHDFLPLDELLNAPMNTITDTVTTITSTGFGSYDNDEPNNNLKNAQVELQATKDHLQIQESRVRHLTALLAENEQDLAKLNQMNEMLKEELRRQERAVEREKHIAENSEYLKNVIIKFVTLSNSDERTRLVPVLNTILRLSRAEMEVLNCVAKGQKVPTDSNHRGWSDYLPKWGNNN